MAGSASRENGKKGGRPKGSLGKRTLEKVALREQVREYILPHVPAMLDAQLANAAGKSYLVTRDKKTGKFIRVGPAMAGNLNEGTAEVWEESPSVQAFTDLMNRLIDKPAEQEQVVKLTADAELIAALQAGRQRVLGAGVIDVSPK